MNKLTQLLTATFLLITSLTFGQSPTPQPEEQPYIEVIGTAEKDVIPDEIYIEIIIGERYVNKDKVTIEEQEEKLKTVIKSLGIDLTNLSLSDANADYVKVKWKQKDVLTKKEYTLKVSKATTVGQVFQKIDSLEIKDAHISKVSHSKIDSLKKETKIAAIKAAKAKADYLLATIGEQTGKPLIIRENDPLVGNNSNVINQAIINTRCTTEGTSYYVDGVKVENEIHFHKIKIQSSVYVKFLIK